MKNLQENSFSPNTQQAEFTTTDYCLFSSMLIISIAVGIYFGCFGNKQKSKNDYLLGGKNMNFLPVAISLVASETSGVAILAVPADVYKYGANYAWTCVGVVLVCFVTSYIYLPVFHKLQLTSSFEYLKLRFDGRVRVLASLLFALGMLLYNSLIIYIPALALSHVTGIGVHLITIFICVICIFYTTVGGLKAVVWTDTIQMVILAGSTCLVTVLGILSAGGISNIIRTASQGHRLDIFDFTFEPTIRDAAGVVILGSIANNLNCISVSQSTVQRLMALPSLADARRALAGLAIGVVIVKLSCVVTGLTIYTKYVDCDLLSSSKITNVDQILPYYILDIASHIPGLPGLFIAGIFSASLSTLSSTLNTLAATIYEDFILPCMSKNASTTKTSNTLKLITIVMGGICTALVLLVEKLGGLLPLSNSFGAISGGPLAGLFTLGMMFPIANAKGALCGSISGLAFLSWVVAGNYWSKQQNYYFDPVKPFSTDGCAYHINITKAYKSVTMEEPFYLYRITFWYHTLIGMTVTMTIGIIVSWFTRNSYPAVDDDLICPLVYYIYKREKKSRCVGSEVSSEKKSLNIEPTDNKFEIE